MNGKKYNIVIMTPDGPVQSPMFDRMHDAEDWAVLGDILDDNPSFLFEITNNSCIPIPDNDPRLKYR